jgi:HPr kinase/phosphorylase
MEHVTVRELLERVGEALGLSHAGGGFDGAADVTSAGVSAPGLLLTGFEEGFRADRIQLLDETALAFLNSLGREERVAAFERLCAPSVPCVIVAGGRDVPPELVDVAGRHGIPVLASTLPSDSLIRDLTAYLDDLLAPHTNIHGTLVDVHGVGLLFTGKSGIGKSECGLDLVEHGHRLVADDVVHVVRTRQDHVVGFGDEFFRHYVEIRGVGIVDVQSMFGIRATRQRKRIEVEVRLVTWSDVIDYERVGFEETKTEILGVQVPLVTLPLVPGKNITVISEVIALNHLLKLRGVHSAKELGERLKELTSQGKRVEKIIRGDNE